MKTSILTILILSFVSFSGFSQVLPLMPKYYQPLDSSILANEKEEDETKTENLMKLHNKVSYSVAVGTGFSSFGNDMSMMNSYIAPTLDYQVNSKLNFSVTGIIMQNNYNGFEGFYGNDTEYMYNSNVSNYGITGSAYYQLSDKWSVWGDGAYLENQSVFNDYRADVYDRDYKTLSIGVGYKLNDNFRFNMQYRYSNGLHPSYQYNPMFNGSRFHNSYDDSFGFWYY
jgi:long-subunit fatty acid transport protein